MPDFAGLCNERNLSVECNLKPIGGRSVIDEFSKDSDDRTVGFYYS